MHCGNCQPIMNLNYSPNCTPFAFQVRSYGKQNIPGGGHTPASPTSVLGKDSSISLTQHPSTEINFLLQYSNTNMEDFVRLIYRKLLLGCSQWLHMLRSVGISGSHISLQGSIRVLHSWGVRNWNWFLKDIFGIRATAFTTAVSSNVIIRLLYRQMWGLNVPK